MSKLSDELKNSGFQMDDKIPHKNLSLLQMHISKPGISGESSLPMVNQTLLLPHSSLPKGNAMLTSNKKTRSSASFHELQPLKKARVASPEFRQNASSSNQVSNRPTNENNSIALNHFSSISVPRTIGNQAKTISAHHSQYSLHCVLYPPAKTLVVNKTQVSSKKTGATDKNPTESVSISNKFVKGKPIIYKLVVPVRTQQLEIPSSSQKNNLPQLATNYQWERPTSSQAESKPVLNRLLNTTWVGDKKYIFDNDHLDIGCEVEIEDNINLHTNVEDIYVGLKLYTGTNKENESHALNHIPSTSTEACAQAAKCESKTTYPEILCEKLMKILKKILLHRKSSLLLLDQSSADYGAKIKQPMNFTTIEQKLKLGAYRDDVWEYIDDVNLLFENARLYYYEKPAEMQYCKEFETSFNEAIGPIMKNLGYCCGLKRYYDTPRLFCLNHEQQCVIKDYTPYWSYNDKYYLCKEHYESPGSKVWISNLEGPNMLMEKKKFVVRYCLPRLSEPYTCERCLKFRNETRHKNIFTAKNLPKTKLGDHIEERVNNFLTRSNSGAGNVTIRVTSSSENIFQVLPLMKERFVDTGIWPEKFPYTAKSIFAFQTIDGGEICFFGINVQEYNSECPQPNARHVYIAYVDSVHYFFPKQFRTAVYHEIIIGYLEYVKKLGYTMAQLWACPPEKHQDYIFHRHPPEQNMPDLKRLQAWYRTLLEKGRTEGIVTEYKDMDSFMKKEKIKCASDLPYFDGDYWPSEMETCIRDVNAEEIVPTSKGKGKGGKYGRKPNSEKVISKNMLRKVKATGRKYKNHFFIVYLHPQEGESSLPPIVDPDPLVINYSMESREGFLSFCANENYEFSTLRKTKFSTMAMLYELHHQWNYTHTCDMCKNILKFGYHCTKCEDDYDLCPKCYSPEIHEHEMERKWSYNLESDKRRNPIFKQKGPTVLKRLENHTWSCKDESCADEYCQDFKIHMDHINKHKLGINCIGCKVLCLLMVYHVRFCKNSLACFPFCIKAKIKSMYTKNSITYIKYQQDKEQRAFKGA